METIHEKEGGFKVDGSKYLIKEYFKMINNQEW